MGDVKKVLAKSELGPRENHNSRLFIDLCENIHIHYREYRHVFSIPEFFEYVDIVNKSTNDVKNYLRNNPDYEEQKYPTTIMVAGGKERQMKFLENSPRPNRSFYMDTDCRIELNEEYVTDEIHVHYRDFRIAMNRENFKALASVFTNASEKLATYERETHYERKLHEDRDIDGWQQPARIKHSDTPTMGVRSIPLSSIKSPWYENIVTDWTPNPIAIEILKTHIRSDQRLTPIILSKQADESYLIVNGHHRVRAAAELECEHIDAVVIELDWEETEKLRQAEQLLKTFDEATDYRFGISNYFNAYIADKLNEYYRDHFYRLITPPSATFRLVRGIKRSIVKLPLPETIQRYVDKLSKAVKTTLFGIREN